MNDLPAFLHDRYNEDEEAARKAAEVCGCHTPAPAWDFADEETDGRIVVVDDPHPQLKRKLGRRWNGSYEGLFTAEHIARHDPARVLREVDAKRHLLQMHSLIHRDLLWLENGNEETAELPVCGLCVPKHLCYQDRDDVPEGPCTTLRLLAYAYTDHPDYRPHWDP